MNIVIIGGNKFVYESASADAKVGFYRPAPTDIPADAKVRKFYFIGGFKKFKKCRKRELYIAYSQGFTIVIDPVFFEKTKKNDLLQFYRTEEDNLDMIVLVNKAKRMIASPYNT